MSQIIPEYNPLIPLPLSTQTQPVSTFPEQLLWKLVKGKTVLQYHLCFGKLLLLLFNFDYFTFNI